MALHKHDHFTADDQAVAAIAKALGHPARIAILRLLAARQSCICGDIVQELPLSQSTVSQHLKELKDAGLVRGEIDGPRVCYCLDPTGWDKARALLTGLLTPLPSPAATPGCAC
jgi:DNA-binding transcriptional ArsR family regulator